MLGLETRLERRYIHSDLFVYLNFINLIFKKIHIIKKFQEVIGLCLKKHAIVSELIRKLLRKVILSSQNSKIRLFEVVNHKIQKEYTETEPIEKIQEFAKLYAEVNIYDMN